MTSYKPSAPETLEELRQAVRDEACTLLGAAETLPGRFPAAAIPVAREAAHRLLRLVPPPIKVGQTVKRCASRDDHLSYEVVAITDGKRVHLWNEETTTPAWDWVHGVRCVDSSPSPEPEERQAESAPIAAPESLSDNDPTGKSAPSPEVPEGWRVPVDRDEVAAARRAGVLRYDYPPESSQPTGWGPIWRPGTRKLRVPSGWAEGRELVPVGRALGRTIGGDPVVKWVADRLGDPSAYVMLNHEPYGRRVPADADGKVWVDPLPGYGETGGAS